MDALTGYNRRWMTERVTSRYLPLVQRNDRWTAPDGEVVMKQQWLELVKNPDQTSAHSSEGEGRGTDPIHVKVDD